MLNGVMDRQFSGTLVNNNIDHKYLGTALEVL